MPHRTDRNSFQHEFINLPNVALTGRDPDIPGTIVTFNRIDTVSPENSTNLLIGTWPNQKDSVSFWRNVAVQNVQTVVVVEGENDQIQVGTKNRLQLYHLFKDRLRTEVRETNTICSSIS